MNEKVLPLPGSLSTQIRPAVVFDDFLADGQAETCAFRFIGESIADLLELLENFGLIGGGNADAGIGDADNQIAVAGAGGAGNRSRIREFDRV